MYRNLSWRMALPVCALMAAGIAAGTAQATPTHTIINNLWYENNAQTTGAPGATGAPTAGGLCVGGSANCPLLPSSVAGTLNSNGLIATNSMASYFDGTPYQGDSNYALQIIVTDKSRVAGSYYEITLDGISIGTTPAVTYNAGTFSSGSFSVFLRNELATTTHAIGITNVYFENGLEKFTVSQAALSLTVTAAPEPATLSIMAAGLGLLGYARKRRARG